MDNFSYLEDQNLKNIKKTQEIEQSIELMTQNEVRTMREIGGEIEIQEGVKKDLEMQIINQRAALLELRKQSKLSQSSAAQTAAAAPKKKYGQSGNDEEPEANIDFLMDDIRKDIINVYKVIGDPNVLEAKQTIDILQVSRF